MRHLPLQTHKEAPGVVSAARPSKASGAQNVLLFRREGGLLSFEADAFDRLLGEWAQ